MTKKKSVVQSDAVLYPFKGLVGYDQVLRRLASVHAAGRLPPALLIEGREGIGKRLLAAAVASLPSCLYGVACGSCDGCRATVYGDNPDLFWIDEPGQVIKLESIKQLQEHLSVKSASQLASGLARTAGAPGGVARRIAVIVDADLMNEHAANRLLKTLEEPSEDGMIIMTTSRMRNMLPTVLSRLVRWHVAPPNEEGAMQVVQKILAQRGEAPCEERLLRTVLTECGYAPGAALERLSKTGEQIGQVDELLASIIDGTDLCNVLDVAAALGGRQRKLGVDLLVQRLEVVLHASYREALGLRPRVGPYKGGTPLTAAALRERRQILQHAHRYAVRNKISLNAQLFLEAVGLAGK